MSYCLVGPLASKLAQVIDDDSKPYTIVKTAIVAYAQGLPIQVAAELGRRLTPRPMRPASPNSKPPLVRPRMNSTPSAPEPIRLPPSGTLAAAEELQPLLVLAADRAEGLHLDASAVENVGQAMLQLLVAVRREAEASGLGFRIDSASEPFCERVSACRLEAALGLAPATE